jgi:hypothetical protein
MVDMQAMVYRVRYAEAREDPRGNDDHDRAGLFNFGADRD